MVSYAEADQHVNKQLQRIIIIGLIFLVAAFAIGTLFTNRLIVKPVFQLVGSAGKISEGDFSAEVALRKNDELGVLAEAFRTLQRELGRLIGEVKAASDKTAGLSRSVYRSSQEISASTEEMAATTSQSLPVQCSAPAIMYSPLMKRHPIRQTHARRAINRL